MLHSATSIGMVLLPAVLKEGMLAMSLDEDTCALVIALQDISAPPASIALVAMLQLRNPGIRNVRFVEYFSGDAEQCK